MDWRDPFCHISTGRRVMIKKGVPLREKSPVSTSVDTLSNYDENVLEDE